jgi:tRNA(Ile)-lysidine synthase
MMCQFEERLSKAWPVSAWQRVPVIVAVSGGADSVALLRGLVSLAEQRKSSLIAAHFNHRLRADSDQDAEFVADLSQQLHVAFEWGVANRDLTAEAAGSIEDAAREARYRFLTEVARRVGARYIATAHTADDQTETILHRIVRGTGVRGLAGIPSSRELARGITLVRPLLGIRHSELVEYLIEVGQLFCQDSTNVDERFTRNRIRHTILPELREHLNSNVDEALCRLATQAAEVTRYVEDVASEWFERAVEVDSAGIVIKLDEISNAPPLIVRTVLRQIWNRNGWPEREMTFVRWSELEQLISAHRQFGASATTTLPGGIRVDVEVSATTNARCILRRN